MPWPAVGAPTAARVPLEASCRALLDATGAKVNRRTSGGPVATSSLRACPAADSLPQSGKQATPSEAIPELSAESPARRARAQAGPLHFAAENPERVGAALLTGGAMIWALHSGLLTWLLLLGVPLWRHVDLLPIVASSRDCDAIGEPRPTHEEAAVAHVLQRGDAGSPGDSSRA
jgi:hypothetical protein